MGHAFEPLSYAIFGACIEVQRQLGPHCMEVDYQRALELALKKRAGLEFLREAEISAVCTYPNAPGHLWAAPLSGGWPCGFFVLRVLTAHGRRSCSFCEEVCRK